MKMWSKVTGRSYWPETSCFITNHKQAALYMKNGVELLDIIVSGEDQLVYVFDKKESAPFYYKWKNYKLV